ncbi:unnamed protein product, partial [Protopolystoma xenopodis]
ARLRRALISGHLSSEALQHIALSANVAARSCAPISKMGNISSDIDSIIPTADTLVGIIESTHDALAEGIGDRQLLLSICSTASADSRARHQTASANRARRSALGFAWKPGNSDVKSCEL